MSGHVAAPAVTVQHPGGSGQVKAAGSLATVTSQYTGSRDRMRGHVRGHTHTCPDSALTRP
eukprot:988026-Rhodomonas_salina.3